MSKVTESNTVRYVRRMPREAYGHEEAEIVLSVSRSEDAGEMLAKAKEDVLNVLAAEMEQVEISGDEMNLPERESFEKELDQMIEESKSNPTVDDAEEIDLDEGDEPEEVIEQPKKKRGRPRKVNPVPVTVPADEDEDDDFEISGEDDDESLDVPDEEDEQPVKPKAKVRTATTAFDTKNKAHQSLVRDVFTDVLPKWQLIAKPKLKEVTAKLNETELLDGEGDVLESFKVAAKKLLTKAQAQ